MLKTMKINKPRIAFEKDEVFNNDGVNVILDIFRFSCTIACLIEKKKEVKVFSNPELAVATYKNEKNCEIYSEIDLGIPDKFDNSPYIARNSSENKKVIVVTNSGSKAVMNSMKAKEILIAGFHNLPYVVEYLKGKENILFVPACIFFNRNHIEDFIAAEIFYEALMDKFDKNKIMDIHKTGRVLELMEFCPQTAKEDLEIILNVGGIKVIPSAKICGVYAEVKDIGVKL